MGDSASKFHSGRVGIHTGIPVRRLPGRTRGPPLKVQLDSRQMLQGGAGHARVHAPVLLPNSRPTRRKAPGGQSNADFHPTRGDCTPLPLPCHLHVTIARCLPPMTRCWLHMDSDTPRPPWAPKHTSESPKEKTQVFYTCMCVSDSVKCEHV